MFHDLLLGVYCNTVPIITANLQETFSHDVVNHSIMARWFKCFQERRRLIKDDAHASCPSATIDNILIATVSTLLNEGRQMMAQKM